MIGNRLTIHLECVALKTGARLPALPNATNGLRGPGGCALRTLSRANRGSALSHDFLRLCPCWALVAVPCLRRCCPALRRGAVHVLC
jgi:hypothetical protein